MTSRLTFTESSHSYWLADPDTGKKQRLPSVTTLLKLLDKPQLKRWAANTAADFAIDHWNDLAALSPSERRNEIAGAPWRQRDRAAAKGTVIHAMAETLLDGGKVDAPESVLAKVRALAGWLEANPMAGSVAEVRVWSEPDDDLGLAGYAGTFDLLAVHPRHGRVLLDWKTGSGPWPEMAMQLAAYAAADWAVLDGEDQPMPRVDTLGIVMVGVDGCDLHLVDAQARRDATCRFELLRALRAIPEPTLTMEV